METKFIEGTNEQYSIREDGVVINHNTKKILNIDKNVNKFTIYPNGVKKEMRRSTLLKKYFNITNLYVDNYSKTHYQVNKDKILEYSRKKYKNNLNKIKEKSRKYYLENSDKLKEKARIYNQNNPEKCQKRQENNRKNITPYYIASIFNITVSELDDTDYQIAKKRIEIKRQLKKDHGLYKNCLTT